MYRKNNIHEQKNLEDVKLIDAGLEDSELRGIDFEEHSSENIENQFLDFEQDDEKRELDKYLFEESRRKDTNLVLLSSILFIIVVNIVYALVAPVIYLIYDPLWAMVISVPIGLLFVNTLFKEKMERSQRPKLKFKFTDFLFFAGLIFITSITTNLILTKIMEIFGLTSVDVTGNLVKLVSPITLIYAILLGPVAEEIQYRHFYLEKLSKYGPHLAIIVSSVTFAFAHMNLLQGIGTLGIGLILGYIAYFYSFKAAVLMHVWNNTYVFIFQLFGLDAFGELNTYGQFIAMAVIFTMIFAVIQLFVKRFKEFKTNLKLSGENKDSLNFLFRHIPFVLYLVLGLVIITYIGSKITL